MRMIVVAVCMLLVCICCVHSYTSFRHTLSFRHVDVQDHKAPHMISDGIKCGDIAENMAGTVAKSFRTILVSCVTGAALLGGPAILPGVVPSSYVNGRNVVHADDTHTSVFTGRYTDPFHPGCLRSISVDGDLVTITGSDSPDGRSPWVITARERDGGQMLVDFSPKGGPKDLLGKYSMIGNRIEWPDGNAWTKIVSE